MEPPLPAHLAANATRAQRGASVVARGIALSLGLGIAKIAGGIAGQAYALVADGIESITDIAVSLLMWGSFQWAARPPDKDHPYGHGKAESVAALLTALVVLGAGVGVGWKAIAEIGDPHRTPAWWTLVILAVVVAIKVPFSRRLTEVGRDTSSSALGAEAWHHLSDAIASAAAFIGISIAVVGGRRYASADGWAALVASVVIAVNGLKIFKCSLGELMDVAVPDTLENEVRGIALGVPGVSSLDKCRIRKSGVSYLVEIEVQVPGDLSVRAGHDIAHLVKDSLLASGLKVSDVTVHIEPS
jgi:cation diffusion facilitator family transporter